MRRLNVHEILEQLRSLLDAESYQGLTLRREYDPSRQQLQADPEMLIQSVLNQLRNAAQAGADPVTPIDKSREIRDRIAGSKLEVIENQRHFSNVEVPETFNAILCAGLDEMIGRGRMAN